MAQDFIRFPELTNRQIEEHIVSPHPQITENIMVKVIKVIDGDTIRVEWSERAFDFPVRFLGIDAPELSEGGKETKEYLEGVILNQEVELAIDPKQRVGKYGRLLARVISLGMDVGNMMIIIGLATTFEGRNESKIPELNKVLRLNQWF